MLHRYYELLAEAIISYRDSGSLYLVTALGHRAGKVLGDEVVAVSTVRYWHAEYVKGDGLFRADERGHHSRDLLVMEEDIKQKFLKWSLAQAKDDSLSVDAARDYLNDDLLIKLEVF